MAFLIRRDLHFTEAQLGAAVSLFFAVSAAGSTLGGKIAERMGAERAMSIVAVGSGAALLGIGGLTRTYAHLLAWLVLAGTSNALCQPATNLALIGSVPRGRQGFALGIKQSAIPSASLLGGLAVPIIGLTVGWRWAFAGAAAVAVLFAVVAPHRDTETRIPTRNPAHLDTGMRGLVMLSVAAGVAFTAISSLGAFYVESAVHFGVGEANAGLWFASGGCIAIIARTTWGWLADRRDGGHLPVVALLIVLGAGGFAVLPFSQTPLFLALGTALAFGAGWSWMGVFHLGVIRQHPDAPAVATGVIQTGAFLGGVVGPLAFGVLVEQVSHQAAWWSGAVALLIAAALALLGRRLVISERMA